jgi:CRP/FNR family cyclic AMP-dependent transcriptional regulator
MASRRLRTGTICHVLREDVYLAEAIPAPSRAQAVEECIATVVRIPRGAWAGHRTNSLPDGIGLLVLEGLLIRHVGIGGSFGAELLGHGDLLCPWQEPDKPILPHTVGWRVLQAVRAAVLDREAARRLARYPELTGRLVAREVDRSRSLAISLAIAGHARVDVRIHMLLWHLADRWGYARPEGTILPLPLTHEVLAELVAARRPTVSTALARLAKDELVHAQKDGWVLSGEPPAARSSTRRAQILSDA